MSRCFFGVVLLVLAAPCAAQDRGDCEGDLDDCRDRVRGTYETCVTSCPRNGQACRTQCRSDLDLAIAGCSADHDGCEDCHRECDRAGHRCEHRAHDGAQRCGFTCGRDFLADVDACTKRRSRVVLLPCLQHAVFAATRCRDACRGQRAHDLGLCADLGDGCHDICDPQHSFPDFGTYGTLANFSIRSEAHLGCARHYPGLFPEDCVSPGPFERDPYARTPSTEFHDAPWLATKFLVRHADARAAVTFSAIEAQNLSENHLDARSPIIVRVLVDDQVIEPAEVRISHTALASGGAFTFVSGALGEGIHIARVQWRVTPDPLSDDDPVGLLRTATLMVRSGLLISPEGDAGATLAVAAAGAGGGRRDAGRRRHRAVDGDHRGGRRDAAPGRLPRAGRRQRRRHLQRRGAGEPLRRPRRPRPPRRRILRRRAGDVRTEPRRAARDGARAPARQRLRLARLDLHQLLAQAGLEHGRARLALPISPRPGRGRAGRHPERRDAAPHRRGRRRVARGCLLAHRAGDAAGNRRGLRGDHRLERDRRSDSQRDGAGERPGRRHLRRRDHRHQPGAATAAARRRAGA